MWHINSQSINSVCTFWNKGVRRILNLPYDAHTWLLDSLLKQNHFNFWWLLGSGLNVFFAISWIYIYILYKVRTGTPGYLSDLLVKQKITKRTRSQLIDAPDRLIVPLYSGERSAGTSYSVAAPKLWNCLPANIRSSRSLDTFKKHLKTHYFKEHFYGINM